MLILIALILTLAALLFMVIQPPNTTRSLFCLGFALLILLLAEWTPIALDFGRTIRR